MILTAVAVAWVGASGVSVAAQDYETYPIEGRIWLDRGDEPLLRRGDQVRIYYRVSESAYVAVFHIDSNGTARLVFPTSPQENHYARGGRDYRVLFPGSSYWFVNDDPGIGYYFLVASPTPFDFSGFRYSHFGGGWDLGFVGRQVYQDPYVAMDEYVAALIPEWEYVSYALDFTAYHVDGHYDYPRFLCYDCHGFLPYRSWNPYHYSCSSFRVVIYNDPYFYPLTRYRGTRVVYVQPRRGVAHFAFKERATGEPGTPQIVVRSAVPTNQQGVADGEARRAVPRGSVDGAAAPGAEPQRAPSGSVQVPPGVSGAAARRPSGSPVQAPVPLTRPSGALPGATAPAAARPNSSGRTDPAGTGGAAGVRPTDPGRIATPPKTGSTDRPVLERRPTSGGSVAKPPATAPPARPTVKVKPRGGGGSATTALPRSGGSSVVGNPPSARGGGSPGSRSTPMVGSGGTTRGTSAPSVRSGGSAPSRSAPTARSGGSSAARSSPPARSTGSGGRPPPAQAAKRPPTRPPGGGGGGDVGGY